MKIGLTSSGPGMSKIHKGLAALDGADVLVGIPEANSSRRGKGVNNAELLFIFTNGSPLRGQPPRVVIEAAIEATPTKDLIAKELAASAGAALDGDEKEMVRHLDRAGTIGESASKRWFTDPRNNWAPNAPSTIKAKGSDTPGIDTGQMRRAMTHVVEAGDLTHSNASDDSRNIEASGIDGDLEDIAEAVGEGAVGAAEAVGETVAAVAEVLI